MTLLRSNDKFGPTRDCLGDISLSRSGSPRFVDLRRRDFLLGFCHGVGATLIPKSLWGLALRNADSDADAAATPEFQLHPRYRAARPLAATLVKVKAGTDEFISERYSEQIDNVLAEWSRGLLASPQNWQALANVMAADFSGASLTPVGSQVVRSDAVVEVRRLQFNAAIALHRDEFLRQRQTVFSAFTKIITAEFQVTAIDVKPSAAGTTVRTRVKYDVVGTGQTFHREQHAGNWDLEWVITSIELRLTRWTALNETHARTTSPVFVDVTESALGNNDSYHSQLLHGTDYWRTVLDGATGIDIYGHNGVSIADIDNDGYDDLYLCQPAGLPNRLYRNRRDGTFEDITESSGLGILENTACALFCDFNNDGLQDVIIVRANGPRLFLNQGGGKFREKPDAFRFATPPQGTFTGAAVADYDRDGWLDIYFCLYAYYQGTGQYKYPSPYHDAKNGPPNFLMRNYGDETFRDVTAQTGLNQNNTRYSFCCAWGDYNGDGWPDLYVVNDFGRKNLYRNNGDGTFTDIAEQAGAQDIGAGMSVSSVDYDNDGKEDLYVGNMWTAAGERIASQELFKSTSSQPVREMYQKHAMGNSLLRNQSNGSAVAFADTTMTSGTGMGRWAWSSDALDFDHDGFSDLYVTNGMVSGPSRMDLNSFFWRQVVAQSPDSPGAAHDYEQGWNAINELIRADGTWSGYERNVFYANNHNGTFSDVSGAVGLDFIEDGRAFALTDFDHDGRLELFLKNRNGPQLQLLKNIVEKLPPSIAFALRGVKSNRDAVGAAITVETSTGRQKRTIQAGSGFLSQHSKDVFFGLGETKEPVRASIHWPSGFVQELKELPVNHRIWIEEGSDRFRMEPFAAVARVESEPASSNYPEILPEKVETWLAVPVSAPDFELTDFSGTTRSLSGFRGKTILLNFSTSHAAESREEMKELQRFSGEWESKGLKLISILTDEDLGGVRSMAQKGGMKSPILHGTDDVIAIYNILYRQLFDRHRDLVLPASFLIDKAGSIVKVYRGSVSPKQVEDDFLHLPTTQAERLARAIPFPSTVHALDVGRNYLSLGGLFFQQGYLDQAETSFQQAMRDDPTSAEAAYGIGSVYLNQNKNTAAREIFERAASLQANYPDTLPDTWNNLGVIATREGRIDDSVRCFERALELSPRHVLSLNNLGNAYRVQKRWNEARTVLERTLEVSPRDAEANYGLGMVFAQTGDNANAHAHLERALRSRPDYPEALNNLGVLYLVMQRRDEAVASFENCIRVAPGFDQAYLNLARVYALGGSRDQARHILQELLKQHPNHEQAIALLNQLEQ